MVNDFFCTCSSLHLERATASSVTGLCSICRNTTLLLVRRHLRCCRGRPQATCRRCATTISSQSYHTEIALKDVVTPLHRDPIVIPGEQRHFVKCDRMQPESSCRMRRHRTALFPCDSHAITSCHLLLGSLGAEFDRGGIESCSYVSLIMLAKR
jgi:hypothetical protein